MGLPPNMNIKVVSRRLHMPTGFTSLTGLRKRSRFERVLNRQHWRSGFLKNLTPRAQASAATNIFFPITMRMQHRG